MMSHSTVAPNLRLYYGFDAGLLGGVVLNDHGGNNPMTFKGDLSVGFTPGVSAFITNNLALEVSVNVLGFNYKCAEQTQDQVTVGRRTTSSLDYKINLMSVGIGISFYL